MKNKIKFYKALKEKNFKRVYIVKKILLKIKMKTYFKFIYNGLLKKINLFLREGIKMKECK